MAEELTSGKIDSIFHIGDISYATGFLVEWDYFLNLITPLASKVSYMTAIGNHERYLHVTLLYFFSLYLSNLICKLTTFARTLSIVPY